MPKSSKSTKSVRRIVKDIVESRIEHKVGAVTQAAAAVTAAGIVDVITQSIGQGSDINNRDGDMIIIDTLNLVYTVKNNLTATTNDVPQFVRMILFADNLNVGATPTVTEVLNSASVYSGYNTVNRQKNRFKIYNDEIFNIVGITAAACQHREKLFKINRKCFYSGASGASTNGKGALFLLTIVDTIASGNTQYAFGWELVYSDA